MWALIISEHGVKLTKKNYKTEQPYMKVLKSGCQYLYETEEEANTVWELIEETQDLVATIEHDRLCGTNCYDEHLEEVKKLSERNRKLAAEEGREYKPDLITQVVIKMIELKNVRVAKQEYVVTLFQVSGYTLKQRKNTFHSLGKLKTYLARKTAKMEAGKSKAACLTVMVENYVVYEFVPDNNIMDTLVMDPRFNLPWWQRYLDYHLKRSTNIAYFLCFLINNNSNGAFMPRKLVFQKLKSLYLQRIKDTDNYREFRALMKEVA